MKFTLTIEKKNANNVGQCFGHNTRLHPTKSQLPKSAWLTDAGHHTIAKWNADLLDKSKALGKRKDAVFAVEMVVQVGDQTKWRLPPTEEHPYGARRPGNTQRLNALIAGAKAAAIKEVGADRIISIELHTDESSPHVHIVFAPILDGKLNAKHWVGGEVKCAKLRERMHAEVSKSIACTYTKGARGGEPHDPLKAAGGPKSPFKIDEVLTLKEVIKKLENQVQTLFSQLKNEFKKAKKLKEENDDFAEKAMKKMAALEAELKVLRPAPLPQAQKAPQGAKNGPEVHLDHRPSPTRLGRP